MKTYIEFYNFWKHFPFNDLCEIRNEICLQGKSEMNSLKLKVIDDLCYLKYNGIEL